jgi:nucleotide-binding universal stress UspA family protein
MQFQNILIPTDFSGSAEQAVQHALTLAAREQAQVLLLHVLPGMGVPGPEDRRQATAEQWLQDLARQASVPVHTLVVWGDPAAEICRVAQERQSDLIAISTHGRTGRELEFIGSVADAVVRRAPCAVLLLRAALFAAAEG